MLQYIWSQYNDRAQTEATASMKSDKDLSTKDYTLEEIEKFSYEDKYEKLLQSHPLLMSTLVGSMTNEGADSLQVSSTIYFTTIIILYIFGVPLESGP